METLPHIEPVRTAVYIGRFQPLHLAHFHTMTEALKKFDHLIVVLGSANQPCSFRNPWLAEDRRFMICEALVEYGQRCFEWCDCAVQCSEWCDRVTIIPQDDCVGDDAEWASQIVQKIEAKRSASDKFVLVGHDKDESTYYLQNLFPYEFESIPSWGKLNATDIRKSYFAGEPVEKWGHLVPPVVARFMRMFRNSDAFKVIQKEMEKWKA